jgi:hypothetical protein
LGDAIEEGGVALDRRWLSRINPHLTLNTWTAAAVLVLFLICSLAIFYFVGGREIMPKAVSVSNDRSLPFPGEHGPEGFATQYICLYVAQLTRQFLALTRKQGWSDKSGTVGVLQDLPAGLFWQ